MGRRVGSLGVVLTLAVGLGAVPVVAGPAGAKPRRPPPPPPAGWTVDRARFEPLDGAPLAVEGLGRYRGALEVAPVPGAGLGVVNDVGFDDYLRGISEVPATWPLEAQKAQAVAARTYALWAMAQTTATAHRAAGADICATDSCQVYVGVDQELRPGAGAWAAAVEATAGQALLYRGSPILAKYSSSNGGRTVAGGKPYLKAADDPDDKRSPLHRWRASYSLGDAGRVLGLREAPAEVRRDGDDMVATVVREDGSTEEARLPALEFRVRFNEAVGAPAGLPLALPSVRFDAHTAEGALVVEGRGWGHGIGLSQHGALGKALRGMKAADILAAYYGGLRPTTLAPGTIPPAIRVALATDAGSAVVSAPGGRFRVTDGNGVVIAHAGSGRWAVSAAPRGGVRIVPPRDQAGPPSLEVVAIEPGEPRSGGTLALRLRLGGPDALTTVSVVGPDGTHVQPAPPALHPAGEIALGLVDRAAAGRYAVAVDRDAGGDRRAAVRLLVEVDRGRSPAVAAGAAGPAAVVPPGLLQAGAASLWVSVVLWAARLRRGRGGQLH